MLFRRFGMENNQRLTSLSSIIALVVTRACSKSTVVAYNCIITMTHTTLGTDVNGVILQEASKLSTASLSLS